MKQEKMPLSNHSSTHTEDLILIKEEDHGLDYFFNNNLSDEAVSRPEFAVEVTSDGLQTSDDRYCELCECTFSTRQVFLRHQAQVHSFCCQRCDITFKVEDSYRAHMKRVHSVPGKEVSNIDNSELHCSKCEFTYPTVISYNRHLALTHKHEVSLEPYELKIRQVGIEPDQNNPFNYCTACEFTFVRKSDFVTHLIRVHDMNLEFLRYQLKIHYTSIKPDPEHPFHFCASCEYTFTNRSSFREHIQRIHDISVKPKNEERVWYCGTCNRRFISETIYRTHLRAHGSDFNFQDSNYYCRPCNQTYATKKSLKRHELAQHKNQVNTSTQNTNNINRYCSSCDVALCSHKSYLRHLESQRHKDIISLPPSKKKTTASKIWKRYCEICKQRFSTMSGYHRHLIFVHKQSIPKPDHLPSYINYDITPTTNDPNNYCTACKRKYSSKEKYRTHLRDIHYIGFPKPTASTHVVKKKKRVVLPHGNLYCHSCKTPFGSKHRYQTHMDRFHSKIKRDPTDALQSSQLLLDMNDPELRCRICDIVYSTKSNYRTHLRKYHHTEIPESSTSNPSSVSTTTSHTKEYFCNICRRQYVNYYNYKKHLAVKHDTVLPSRKGDPPEVEYNPVPDRNDPYNRCATCQKVYSTKKNYRSHLSKIHGMKSELGSLSYINLDVVPDINVKDNRCTACNRVYYSKYNLYDHFIKVHGLDIPKYKTSNQRPIKRDVIPDINNPDKWCASCDRAYASAHNFRTHLKKVHHMNIPKRVSNTPRKRPAVLPKINDRNNHCSVCETNFPNRKDYHAHLQNVHDIKIKRNCYRPSYINLDSVPEIGNVDDMCTACNRKYSSERALRRHLISVHGLNVPIIKRKVVKESSGKADPETLALIDKDDPHNICGACRKTYASKYSYRDHLNRVHQMNLPAYSIKEEPDYVNSYASLSSSLPSSEASTSILTPEKLVRKKSTHKRRCPDDLSIVSGRLLTKAEIVSQNCIECGIECSTPRILRTHMRYVHKIDLPSRKKVVDLVNYEGAPPDVNDPDNWCSVCEKFLSGRYKFERHLNIVHGIHLLTKNETIESLGVNETKNQVQNNTGNSSEKRDWECDECGLRFHDNLLYQIHLVEGHDAKEVPNNKGKKRVQWCLPLVDGEESN